MIFKSHRSIHFIFGLVIILIASSIMAQDQQEKVQQEISRDSLLTVAHTIIDSARCRTFITVDENGTVWKNNHE